MLRKASGPKWRQHPPPQLHSECSACEYFSAKGEQKGIGLSELLTEVLKRDIEINEALK